MAPLVSILIPCYNAAPYLAIAIESALAQTWTDKEIIVVNDGSTDGSLEILNSYRQRGVRIINQENRGQSAAVNRAFAASQGHYIKFFDADDLLDVRMIELQMTRLGGSTTAIASGEWGRFYHDDPKTFRLNPQRVWQDMRALDWLVQAWDDARQMMQCASWLIPRRVLELSGLWNEELSFTNDFEFFTRVLCHTEQVLFTPGARIYYRSGIQGSLSASKGRKAVESAFKSLVLGTEYLLKHRCDGEARRACANLMQDFIYTYYPEHGDLRQVLGRRIRELGGSDLQPDGSPNFHLVRQLMGWRIARRLERSRRKLSRVF